MKIGTEITLTEAEQAICRLIAKMRFEECRKANITNAKIGDLSNEETDLEGFAAEMAFGNIFNLYPDFCTTPPTTDGSYRGDFLIEGKTVDVKSSTNPNGLLICVPWKKEHCDLYALVVGQFPTYTFKGFLQREELFREYKYIEVRKDKPMVYAAYQWELWELEDIQKYYKENQERNAPCV
jgi:hypothetical protein